MKAKTSDGLSKEQHEAVHSFGRQVCVWAGAGSGKTRVLVARYVEALRRGAAVESILAVTFTEKAATEMKERLNRQLTALGFHAQRRSMEHAWIGTIHSFCARILRENPVECGVDPSFSMMGEGESGLLMKHTLDLLMEEESGNSLWIGWLAQHGEETAQRVFRDTYAIFRGLGGEESILRVDECPAEANLARQELNRVANAALQDLAQIKDKTSAEGKLGALASQITVLLNHHPQDLWKTLSQLREAVGTGKIERRGEKIKAWVLELEASMERYKRLTLQVLTAPIKREFVRIFLKWISAYESEKRRLLQYDFDDLLYRVYKVFSDPDPIKQSVRKRYQQLFAHLFVDEFQDTSSIQWRLLELLKREDNLFVVGDIQQSIYRFRQADPAIFRNVRRQSEVHALRDNYRTRPEILRFVNQLFQPLFGDEFQELMPKRTVLSRAMPCVELICVPQDAGESLDEARVFEAGAIARRIRELVAEEIFQYRDIAILMKKSTSSRYYEKELQDLHIPYYFQKGRGFYEQHEVVDLLNFLRLLENGSSENDVAAAAVLRSPLVGVSDEGLFWLGELRRQEKQTSFMNAIASFRKKKEISAPDAEKIEFFLQLLAKAHGAKDRMKISELLDFIVTETAYDAKVLTLEGGVQALANIRKLIDMASGADDSLSGSQDFVDWMSRLSEEDLRESEAQLTREKENVVRLLTVHSSKGLEFPCVILADMGGKKGNENRPAFCMDTRVGLGARLQSDEDDEWMEDAAYGAIREAVDNENEAESNRLLYVAMTRCRDRLILSGAAPAKKTNHGSDNRGTTWMGHVLGFLKISADALKPGIVDCCGVSFKIHVIAKGMAWRHLSEPKISPKPQVPLRKGDWFQGLKTRLAPTVKEYESLEDLTVTALVDQVKKKQEMIVDADHQEDETRAMLVDDDVLPRNEYGTVFHRLMEISVKVGMKDYLSGEVWDRIVSVLSMKERDEMKQSFERFWKHPIGESLKKASKCFPELPFIYKTKHGILKGQIDLVFKDPAGTWTVLDYKTNRFVSSAEKEKAVAVYRWQLGLYALAFSKLTGDIPGKTVLYFTADHETVEICWVPRDLVHLAKELDSLYRSAVLA